MKFTEDRETGLYLLQGYGDGWVQVNDRQLTSGFMIGSSVLLEENIPAKFAELKQQHLEPLLRQNREIDKGIVLIGTGRSQCLPTPEIHQALIANKIRFEFMTTAAACRTYKVLNAEGRSVLALLFPA